MLQTFYISLIGPLLGCYLKVEAETEIEVRIAMNCSKLQKLWCSIDIEEPFESKLQPFYRTPVVIPVQLDTLPIDWHEYKTFLAPHKKGQSSSG